MAVEVLKQDTSTWPRPLISIVIPLLNEAENILPLYQSLQAAMDRGEWTWEVIFVDDGSTDTTFKLLQELHEQDEPCAGAEAATQLRADSSFGSRLQCGARFHDRKFGRRPAKRPAGHRPTRGEVGTRLRRGEWLARTPTRELLASPPAVPSGKLADQSHDWRSPP